MADNTEILANKNRVEIEGLKSGLSRIEIKIDELDSKVNNELLHRLPAWIVLVISSLTALLGASGMAIITLLKK